MKFSIKRIGVYARERCLASAGRAPQYKGEEMLPLYRFAQWFICSNQMLLAHKLLKRLRPNS
jgi:hypothetical protein